MADEQPNTPSAEPSPQASAPASAAVSEPTEEQPSEAPSWWQRLLGRQPREASPEVQEPEHGAEPAKVVLTQEELERRIQAETDRREARRKQAAETEARRKLRDEDPWAYAEQDRKAEQAATSDQSMMQLFASIGAEHDRASIDPLMQQLPQQERERILGLEGASLGLDGRRLIVTEAMKSLEKRWRAEGAKDAEERLRKNPAFRKQILGESRGQYAEPELLSSGSPRDNGRSGDDIVNDMLRRQLGIHRET
jgi:hypothetical protein